MHALKYGVTVPLQDARLAADLAREAELAGWDGFFVGEAIWSVDPWVTLTLAAARTERIRLGTMLTPMPLLRPWKLASEVATLDHVSGGRVTLTLGMGAVWMGWQAFPSHPTDAQTRAELLDEGIDVLDILLRSSQEDYDGRHFPLRLSAMDTMHYPPPSVQKPRVPIWVVAVWPKMKSMRRALRCDGLVPHAVGADGKLGEVQPGHIAEMRAFVEAERTRQTHFDYVVEGCTVGLDHADAAARLRAWREAGATWWNETLFGVERHQMIAHIQAGPPRVR